YGATSSAWEPLGTTPLITLYPRGPFQLRFELEGFRPYEAAAAVWHFNDPFPLDRVGALCGGVAHVPGGGFGPGPEGKQVRLNSYLIDRYEVTNRRFKAFIDAGGYQRPEFWRQPFEQDGRRISWEKGVARFTDRTGRPGPSTWELSNYPRGQ